VQSFGSKRQMIVHSSGTNIEQEEVPTSAGRDAHLSLLRDVLMQQMCKSQKWAFTTGKHEHSAGVMVGNFEDAVNNKSAPG